jgi:hypothetical protein
MYKCLNNVCGCYINFFGRGVVVKVYVPPKHVLERWKIIMGSTTFMPHFSCCVYDGIPTWAVTIAPCYVGPCHHGMVCPWVLDGGNDLQIWKLAANSLNKQPWTADRGWSSSLGVGQGGSNSSVELNGSGSGYGPVTSSYEYSKEPSGSIKGREFHE